MRTGNIDIDDSTISNINTLSNDYLVETIIASFMEKGMDAESVRIVRIGKTRATVGKDIEQVSIDYDWEHESNDRLKFYINREGIYDILPEGIFFQGSDKGNSNDIKATVEKIKKNRQEEARIRQFFSVFENEIDHTLVQAHLQERKVIRSNTSSDMAKIFIDFWPILGILTLEQSILFMHMIPVVHKLRGDKVKICKILTQLLGLPVELKPIEIKKITRDKYLSDKHHTTNKIIIDDYMYDGQQDIQMIIKEIPQNRIVEFLKNGKGRLVIEEMISMLFPADAEVEVKFLQKSEGLFILSDDEQIGSRLGIESLKF